MKTLVLSVDRDDDFGRKAKIKSPIIGIKDNIEAAHKLGEVDPEDSDLNAIFSAISTYKSLKQEKEDVEIATICGDIKVGYKSDRILSRQLEKVIEETDADEVLLLSDGAEDEYILPIIESRISITSVKRVSIKQGGDIEDTYYRFVKLFSDDKIQKQFVLPLALVLIVWSFFAIIDMASAGFGAIVFTLGIYMLIRVFKWERNLEVLWEEIKSSFLTGKLSFYTSILSSIILIANTLLAYDTVTKTNFTSDATIVPILLFASNMIIGVVLAGLLTIFGRVVDVYVRDRKVPWRYWVFPFSVLAFGFISYAVFKSLYQAMINWPEKFSILPFTYPTFIGFTSTGILIAIVGAVTHHYIKDMQDIDEKETEIEQQTQKLAEEH